MDRDSTTAPARTVADVVRAALEARGTLTPESAVELLAPLPDALDAARVHGAATPRTTGDDGNVLAALGLAAAAPSEAPAPFHAPELDPGGRPTARSDVYAIAGLLRTAITGQSPPPWTLATLPPADGARQLGDALGALIWEALADDPMQRPVTPAAFLQRAADAVARDATPHAGASAPELPSLPAMDNPRALLVGAGAILAFLVGLVFAIASGGSTSPAAPDPIAALPLNSPASLKTAEQVLYAADMRTTMRKLNTRRIARRTRLAAARTAPGQARAATALGDAYGLAARSVEGAPVPPRALNTNRGIARVMRQVESAYRVMARGARDADRAEFVRGRDAVRQLETFLQRRIQGLERVGYVVA